MTRAAALLTLTALLLAGCAGPPEVQIKNAVMDGNARKVGRLLRKDPRLIGSVDPTMGWTPLHWAAQKGDMDVVKLLLSKGADVNAYHEKAGTPLHMAVYSGQAEVARLLIAGGADLNVVTKAKRESPLYLAIYVGFPEIARMLIESGADIHVEGPAGSTLLHTAVFARNKEIAGLLVENGADLEAKDEAGMTPLHWGVAEGGDPDLVAWLLEKGADPNSQEKNGCTPLHLAIIADQTESARHLVESGANINARTTREIKGPAATIPAGATALKLAEAAGRNAIVEMLKSRGAKH